jgi:hypothetical protein
MIWKLNHVVWTDQVLGARGSVPACARPAPRHIRWPEVVLTSDDHIETTCRWSIPLTRFGKAKASRYGKGRRGDPAAFNRKWLLRNRITSLLDPGSTNKLRLASLFGGGSPYLPHHRAPRLLSVTESIALPPRPKGAVNMSNIYKFNLREWLVPPVLLPIFFVLLVAAAMLIQL